LPPSLSLCLPSFLSLSSFFVSLSLSLSLLHLFYSCMNIQAHAPNGLRLHSMHTQAHTHLTSHTHTRTPYCRYNTDSFLVFSSSFSSQLIAANLTSHPHPHQKHTHTPKTHTHTHQKHTHTHTHTKNIHTPHHHP